MEQFCRLRDELTICACNHALWEAIRGVFTGSVVVRAVAKVRAANCAHLLLLVYNGLNVTEDAFQDIASEVIFFQQKPVLKEVMDTVEAMAEYVYGPRLKCERTSKKQRTTKSSPRGDGTMKVLPGCKSLVAISNF